MPFFDDKENEFINNIINGQSNVGLYRAPAVATKPLMGPDYNLKFADETPQVDTKNVQPDNVVSASADIDPVEFKAGYKPKTEEVGILVDNSNRAIKKRQADSNALYGNVADLSKQQEAYKLQIGDAINTLGQAAIPYQRSDELNARLAKASRDVENAERMPERDLMSQAILSFGPALLGAFTGEAGAMAAPEAQKQGQAMYETQRKEQAEQIKERNKLLEDKYNKLVKVDQTAADDWLAKQKLNVDQATGKVKALEFVTGLTAKDLAQAQELGNKAAADAAKLTVDVAGQAAKIEGEPAKEDAKLKRAKILAGIQAANKPPTEFQGKNAMYYNTSAQAQQNINDIVKKNNGQYPSLSDSFFRTQKEIISGKYSGISMTDFLNKFVKDPAVRSQAQAEIQFLEGIGRINSGAAITPTEWLTFREQYFPTYGDQADSVAIKERQRNVVLQSMKSNAGKASTINPVSVVTPTDQKIINGIAYKKVNGGWQKVQNGK